MTPAGYSGTPLARKLGMKPGARVWVVDPPGHYWELLAPLPAGVRPARPRERGIEIVHIFARTRRQVSGGLERARRRIAPSGMVWISWPKQSSGVETELDGNVVRALGLATGLVDVKVCAVDDVWSGLKFVIRVADRGG